MKSLFAVAVVLVCGFVQTRADDKDLPLPTDQKFLAKAIECTMSEIKFAETALKRSASPDVKQLAQTIKDEHSQCLKKLSDEAAKHKLAVVEGLNSEQKDTLDRLNKLEGKAFDQEYVRGTVERHEKAIRACEAQIKDGKIESIKSYCKEGLPKLKDHLEAAKKVQANLK